MLVPIKAFHRAKLRLAGHLEPSDRERLARSMATRVVEAARPLPVFVACDDESVAEWADERGAEVLWGPGLGLNGAIDHGVTTVAGKGVDHVVVTHSDLPLAERFDHLVRPDAITLVPDRRFDGTNVVARPCNVALAASYGGGSFDRHLAAALASGAPVSVRRDRRLAIDIDTADDCRHPLVAGVLAEIVGVLPTPSRR